MKDKLNKILEKLHPVEVYLLALVTAKIIVLSCFITTYFIVF